MKSRLIKQIESLMTGQDNNGFLLLRYFLYLVSIFYGGAVKLRALLFRRRVFRSEKLTCPVISIGNLTMGGTGKTPMVVYVAGLVQRLGYRPAVVSRGYRGRKEKSGGVVSDGRHMLLGAEDAGDEAFMMARKLPRVPVLVGQNRFLSGQRCVDDFGTDVVILDDGFQHLKLERDIDLVLMDETWPLGNGHLFPRGMLREPVSALKRADACVLTRCKKRGGQRLKPGPGPFFRTCHEPYLVQVVAGDNGGVREKVTAGSGLEWLRGRSVLAFSGIARNHEFRRMLETLGCRLASWAEFPDHHWYTPDDFKALTGRIAESSADMLITTDKDYARIHDKIKWPVDLVVIGIRISFMGQEDEFSRFLNERLEKLAKA